MAIEIWKPIQGFEGKYVVSSFGKVKSLTRDIVCEKIGNQYTRKVKERILVPFKRRGYYTVQLCVNGESKNVGVHQLVANAFLDNPLKKPQVNHINGNKEDNHVDNLEWVTNAENEQHAIETGLILTKPISVKLNDKTTISTKTSRNMAMTLQSMGYFETTTINNLIRRIQESAQFRKPYQGLLFEYITRSDSK